MPKLMREEDGMDKYLVINRKGRKPEFRTFVLGSRDPAALAAFDAYILWHEENGTDSEYVESCKREREVWQHEFAVKGEGNPAEGAPEDEPLVHPDSQEVIRALQQPNGTSFFLSKRA